MYAIDMTEKKLSFTLKNIIIVKLIQLINLQQILKALKMTLHLKITRGTHISREEVSRVRT